MPMKTSPVERPSTTPQEYKPYVYRGEGTGWFQLLLWSSFRVLLQFLAIIFFGVRIYGRENIPRKGAALLLTNHQSFLDPWLIGIALYRQIHFVARESLFRGGFVQYVLERTNAFPIKRGRADASAMRESLNRLAKGHLLNLFPEATRSKDGSINPVGSAVSVIIRRAKVPVIPIVIDGAFEAWSRNRILPKCYPIRVIYGKPIPAEQLAQLDADEMAVFIRKEFIRLQEAIHSPHAAQSRARLEADIAKGQARLVVSKEFDR
jgi:1-acyl-sn-glycerol-3-phosphate acyltransferase